MKTGVILIILIFVIASNAETINVPDDHETIQEAINASEDGDTVLVAAGEYVENITIEEREITVIGNPEDNGYKEFTFSIPFRCN